MFPACFTYGLEVNAGPSLLFDTMASVFKNTDGRSLVGKPVLPLHGICSCFYCAWRM